ncbi:GGDEF and EAL domain-containing protein [Persephonella atlantica]|uniref:GGDEF and EAL domain-containing protein n=1 Tax=Persephonella atlantica TaxID=2699429 RepID=A0ABS1GGQ8_9AQUI|nr:GGDEF and EAL domain-containing protein [Persephonella atlantica]MBK3332107.1 GGDEF and EAL domain-containing protein [Persephonella atlantica]
MERKIVDISTGDVINAVTKSIYRNFPESDFLLTVLYDRDYEKRLKKILSVFLSERLKYIFVIYRDTEGKYKYLLDVGSTDNVSNLIFMPLKEERSILEKVYKEKKKRFEIHREVDTIGITYYVPLLQSGSVKSVLIADFSFGVLQEIKSLILIIQRAILVSSGVILLFLAVAVYNFYRNVILKQRAYIDSLTGIYNRNYLEDIRDVIDLSRYVVLMLDIDFFKNINDTYGHQVGDEILKGIADLLKKNLRDEDIIIRYGGEEFLILIKKSREDKEGKWSLQVAQKLLQEIRDFKYKGINLTASIGLNLDTYRARNLMDAIKKADITLYKAKRYGRNRIEIYKETKGYDRDVSLAELKDIIENGDVVCFYQPVINLKDGRVVYYESLARIKYRERYLSPAQYIDMIKGTFLYFKFTKIVIEYNLNILKKYPRMVISINMSPSDFLNQTIIDILTSVDKKTVKRIKLEVLETEDVHNYNVLKENINKLKSFGYDIVLDDFGAGYVDFYYLTEIDARCIKIDGSVIKKIPYNQQYYKLAKHLVQFCKDINKIPIAEFVENKEVCRVLIELGIEYGQGYYFSEPLPVDKIKQFPVEDIP